MKKDIGKDKLYLVIPAYNEQDNIRNVIDSWYPIVEKIGYGSKLVIIDDGSKDDTYKIIKECNQKYPQLEAITKPNEGHGATVLYGYYYALEHGADYIFQTDSDGQTLPEEFEPFWNIRNDYDMVIGWRDTRQDGISRIFVTKVLKIVIRLYFGVTVKDANTPYRLMNAGTLKETIGMIPPKFNLSNVILSVIYEKKKYRVKYMPITFLPRQGGINSINMKRIIKIGKQAIKDFKEINQELSLK